MGWQTTGDGTVFLAAAGAFLRAERARNTVFLTVTETIRANPARYRGSGPDGVDVHQRSRLYRLTELTWPDPHPDGAPRVPGETTRRSSSTGSPRSGIEVHDMGGTGRTAAVRDRLSYGGLILWELNGLPVATAGLTRQVAGMVRAGPVYTPPELRGYGYASAVTAEVSRAALASGAEEVLLYTDLANPVSNSIYQRIGYRPAEDRIGPSLSGR